MANYHRRTVINYYKGSMHSLLRTLRCCLLLPAKDKSLAHGLFNVIDTKAKCRHAKKLICKGTLRQVIIRVYTMDTVSHVGIFDPAL